MVEVRLTWMIISKIVDEGKIYFRITARFVKRGINIPENDIWIAATVINYKLKPITFDEHLKYHCQSFEAG